MTDVTGVAIRVPRPRAAGADTPSFRASPQAGVAIRSPRARRRGNLFYICLRRGTFVSSDKSTQKRRLKLRFKTSSARCALPQTCLCSSRNRFFRVPLSVKRTVPPQLSAVASLPLPRATVAASSSTAVPGERDERRGFPRRFAPRNDNVRGLYNEILAAQRAAPTFCGAKHRKRRDLIIATPHGREFPKGEGAHALSLWTL